MWVCGDIQRTHDRPTNIGAKGIHFRETNVFYNGAVVWVRHKIGVPVRYKPAEHVISDYQPVGLTTKPTRARRRFRMTRLRSAIGGFTGFKQQSVLARSRHVMDDYVLRERLVKPVCGRAPG
jgi:hypothetical protein